MYLSRYRVQAGPSDREDGGRPGPREAEGAAGAEAGPGKVPDRGQALVWDINMFLVQPE